MSSGKPAGITTRRVLLAGFLLAGLAGGAGVVFSERIRWRAQVAMLKLTGNLSGITWGEMIPMLAPGSDVYLMPLVETRNPYESIATPRTSPTDLAAGAETFAARCSSCHGPGAAGGSAPSLVTAMSSRSMSDWALYKTIRGGIEGTAMPAADLPTDQTWQVVGYIQSLRGPSRGEVARETPDVRVRPIPAQAIEQARTTPGDWLTYSGAYDSWRYSPLDQITRDNVRGIRLLWMHQIIQEWPVFETSPIAVDGTLFVTTSGNGVMAIDAATGITRWHHYHRLPGTLSLCCGRMNRGLAILDSTVYMATLDARVVALDTRTGAVRWDLAIADPEAGFSFTSAPLAVRDLVVIGSAGGEFAARGFIVALDAKTGAERWRFETIPGEGEPGHETWSGDSWKTGGGPAWLTGSYDPALGLVYFGIGNPNPDYNGDSRRGDNLYTNSVVALDAASGALRWHFQFTPHDLHDWDAAQIPVLVDATDGRRLMLWANRNGFYYVLDRTTGAFLHGREFVPQTWAEGLDANGRPIERPGIAPTREGVLIYPGAIGATNWWSPSYHPGTGTLFVPTMFRADVFHKSEETHRPPEARLGGGLLASSPRVSRSTIRALDAMTGELRWEHRVADTMLMRQENVGGLLSTAGGILFGGADDLLVALDVRDGRRLWEFRAGGVHAAPITYLVNNRQVFTIAVGRALLTFGLDPAAPAPRP